MLIFQLLSSLLLSTSVYAKYIVPGGRWIDTAGNLANAHAGGITGGITIDKDTGKFWWFGEYKIQGQPEGVEFSAYSSDDLATWEYHGLAFLPVVGDPIISPKNVLQRPKVVYSPQTRQYHMWWHADNSTYGLLKQGFATSDTIAGPYTFVSATAPLGNWSQHFGMFTDYGDRKSYSLYSNGDGLYGRDMYITSFNEKYNRAGQSCVSIQQVWSGGPSIIQTEKGYYAPMSHKTGYRPNNVVVFRADSLAGPWSMTFFAAARNTRTFNSQSGFMLRINGTNKTTYLYLGDQVKWPLFMSFVPDDSSKTGEWKPIEGCTSYYAKGSKLAGNAFRKEASFTSQWIMVTGIYGNDSSVTFEGIEGTGKPQWALFYYQNIDDQGFGDQPGGTPDHIEGAWQLQLISSVVVNNDTSNLQTLYQPDTHKGIILLTPLKLHLAKGRGNAIMVRGLFTGFDYEGADLERIVVYPPED